jgi:hypothetical protein
LHPGLILKSSESFKFSKLEPLVGVPMRPGHAHWAIHFGAAAR